VSKLLATMILVTLAIPETVVAATSKSTMLYPCGLAEVRFSQPISQVEATFRMALRALAYP
jgi:alpha-D-ribose 1-methylphosphonate 5-triphosphate synthase subunit PhnH